MSTLTQTAIFESLILAFASFKLHIVIPLFIACLFVLIAIPVRARRGGLTIPACVGTGLGTAVLALIMGKLAGVRGITGTTWGVLTSILFFLLLAATGGSLLGLLFYREPPER